jgi:hypothetical protein
LSQGVVSLHDNGRPQTAHLAVNTTGQVNSEVLGHPTYSPELEPSDFHPFGPLKNALRSRRFVDDDEVKEAVHESFVIKYNFFTVTSRSLKIAGLHRSRRKKIVLKSSCILISVKRIKILKKAQKLFEVGL